MRFNIKHDEHGNVNTILHDGETIDLLFEEPKWCEFVARIQSSYFVAPKSDGTRGLIIFRKMKKKLKSAFQELE